MRFLFLLLTAVQGEIIDNFLQELKSYYVQPVLEDSWQHAFDQRGLQRLENKLQKDHFVIAAIGSSVVVGHDGCAYDSFEHQLERSLTPLFKAYDKTIEVRNAGQGGGCGDSHMNQVWCVRQLVGDDVDLIIYSWSYFEAGRRDTNAVHEQFIRWSLLLESAPIPIIMNTMAGPREGAPDKLYDTYKQYGYNTLYLERGIHKYYNFKRKWGAIGDGNHTHRRNADKLYKNSEMAFFNWHPGGFGFQIVADALALPIAKALKRVVSNKVQRKLLLWQSKLPKPVFCDPKLCGSEEPPSCLYLQEPYYGRAQIRIVDKKSDDLFPYEELYNGQTDEWKYYKPPPSKLIPREERGLPECQHLDYCSARVSKPGEWITFRLPRMQRGLLYVCASQDGKKSAEKLKKLRYVFDGQELDPTTFETKFSKCVQVLKEFPETMSDSSGHLYLAIQGADETVKLSHVFAL